VTYRLSVSTPVSCTCAIDNVHKFVVMHTWTSPFIIETQMYGASPASCAAHMADRQKVI